jgi:hypothetical protein
MVKSKKLEVPLDKWCYGEGSRLYKNGKYDIIGHILHQIVGIPIKELTGRHLPKHDHFDKALELLGPDFDLLVEYNDATNIDQQDRKKRIAKVLERHKIKVIWS